MVKCSAEILAQYQKDLDFLGIDSEVLADIEDDWQVAFYPVCDTEFIDGRWVDIKYHNAIGIISYQGKFPNAVHIYDGKAPRLHSAGQWHTTHLPINRSGNKKWHCHQLQTILDSCIPDNLSTKKRAKNNYQYPEYFSDKGNERER